MSETWKAVVGYESIYEVSSYGNVRKLRSGFVKLTEENICEAIEMRKQNISFDKIGEHFGMKGSSVFQAIQSFGKTDSRRNANRIRKPYINVHGYQILNLCKDGETKTRAVHQLVAESFLGPCPDDLEIDHINGDPADNRVENIHYVTHAENLVKRRKHSCAPKLEEADAIFMRGMRVSGYTIEEIAKGFGVTVKTVYDAIQKKSHYRTPL